MICLGHQLDWINIYIYGHSPLSIWDRELICGTIIRRKDAPPNCEWHPSMGWHCGDMGGRQCPQTAHKAPSSKYDHGCCSELTLASTFFSIPTWIHSTSPQRTAGPLVSDWDC
ncbi:mCG148218 [Mus musculus]|uniref:Uncharacterized protein n=1 Tax=Mus musculus TaxID=10090 RepID=Q9D4Q3_MOUSE|nr:mCG148218 [Mus musculus]BAB30187.1 unnamed protein product [Mus musculus]